MPSATYDTAEVQARRSLVPQTEALGISLDALPIEERKRFVKLFGTFVATEDDGERNEIREAIIELLDPDARIITRTISVDEWGSDSPFVEQLEDKKRRFSENVEQRMRKLGISQRDLASRFNVTASNISQIISGRYKPQPTTLARLAKALKCDTGDLWPGGDYL